jgi:hypothetical protein
MHGSLVEWWLKSGDGNPSLSASPAMTANRCDHALPFLGVIVIKSIQIFVVNDLGHHYSHWHT